MKKIDNGTKEENKFMQLWHNKRTHAAMVLGLWMLFLLFVIIISFIGGEATKNENNQNVNTPAIQEEVTEFKDYKEMQAELLKLNFEYEYSITNGNNKVVYKGEKIDNLETGYRETHEETIKYYIDETGLYKVQMDELYALDKLYENIFESLIDPEYIFNTINEQSYLTEESDNTRFYTYKFILDGINYEVVIYTDLENITQINVKFEDNLYELKYTNINQLENLSYIPKEAN